MLSVPVYLNPEVVEWQTDLVVSYYKLSEIQSEKQVSYWLML